MCGCSTAAQLLSGIENELKCWDVYVLYRSLFRGMWALRKVDMPRCVFSHQFVLFKARKLIIILFKHIYVRVMFDGHFYV